MGTITQIYPETDNKNYLPDSAYLWRYVPLRTLLFYLTGNIFIPSIETFRLEDPFEGRFLLDARWFHYAMQQKHGERLDKLQKWFEAKFYSEFEIKHIKINRGYENVSADIFKKHYFAFLRKTRYAWCWFQSDIESSAMWNNYGKQGVAIRTRVGKLRNLLKDTERDFAFGKMRYVGMLGDKLSCYDFNPEAPSDRDFILKPHFLKRSEYNYESEVRFVTAAPERDGESGIILDKANPVDWIEEVLLWPGLKPLEVQSIKQVVAHFAPMVPCECSGLFGTEQSSLENFAAVIMAKLYRESCASWKDGSDGIPPEMKQL